MPQATDFSALLAKAPTDRALTFGVELEFLLATEYLDYSDSQSSKTKKHTKRANPFPNDPRRVSGILDHPHPSFKTDRKNTTRNADRLDHECAACTTCIADSLTASGVPASPFYKLPPYILPEEAAITGVSQTWEIKRDTSVFIRFPPNAPENWYKWQSVEIASPVFYSIPEAFKEIRKCGLHVHVGNGVEGFDLGMLKKLMVCLWSWEGGIHSLHPYERTSAKSGCVFSKPLRCRGAIPLSGSGKEEGKKDGLKLTNHETLRMIWKCKSKEELIYWLSHPETYNAYKLENLLDGSRENHTLDDLMGTSKKTIEFRQHEGTLDADRIINWARLVIGFADKARWVDVDKMLKRVLDQLDVESKHPGVARGRSLEEMLAFFGGKDLEAFYTKWLGNKREWLREQVGKREDERRRDEEEEKAKMEARQTDAEKTQIFEVVEELRFIYRKLAKLEASQLAKMKKAH